VYTIKIKATMAIIIKSIIYGAERVNVDVDVAELKAGNGVLTITGAKIYSCGGGWYRVSGYAMNGKDVHDIIDLINELMARKAVTKEGGYYFNKDGNICGTY